MEQNKPEAITLRFNETCPDHKVLVDAINQWRKEAPEGEEHSLLAIQVSVKDDELATTSHICGNTRHLAKAVTTIINLMSPENPTGLILRVAMLQSLADMGIIQSPEEDDAEQPEEGETDKANEDDHE